MTNKLDNVKEISDYLGIKPPRAYELATLWEKSNGREGLPCIRLGKRQLRFSRAAVEAALNQIDRFDPINEEAN